MTPDQASRIVEKTLLDRHIMLRPRVAITVEKYSPQKVSVLGEVRAPGAYAINTPRSVLDVLTLAGALTDAADRKVLIECRGTKERVPYFVSNKPDVALDTAVQVNPGDSIIVAKAGIVYVLGDVARPGGYTMTNNETQLTVLELVARAGGTNHSAVPSHAKLIHRNDGKYVEEPLPLSAMQKGNRPDLALKPDDVIGVPFSYMRNFGLQASGLAASLGSAAIYQFLLSTLEQTLSVGLANAIQKAGNQSAAHGQKDVASLGLFSRIGGPVLWNYPQVRIRYERQSNDSPICGL